MEKRGTKYRFLSAVIIRLFTLVREIDVKKQSLNNFAPEITLFFLFNHKLQHNLVELETSCK